MHTYGNEKERKERGKRKLMLDHEHNVQERTRSKYSLSTVDIYAKRALRPPFANPAMRKVVLTLSLYVSYLLLLSIFLLTLLMSIIFPSYKVIEETITMRPYYIIVPSFYAFFFFTKFIIHAYVMER